MYGRYSVCLSLGRKEVLDAALHIENTGRVVLALGGMSWALLVTFVVVLIRAAADGDAELSSSQRRPEPVRQPTAEELAA